jgi:hypothetical protein
MGRAAHHHALNGFGCPRGRSGAEDARVDTGQARRALPALSFLAGGSAFASFGRALCFSCASANSMGQLDADMSSCARSP